MKVWFRQHAGKTLEQVTDTTAAAAMYVIRTEHFLLICLNFPFLHSLIWPISKIKPMVTSVKMKIIENTKYKKLMNLW